MIRNWLGGLVLAAGLVAGAQAADFHQTFEARCASCHGHAGAFACETLTESDGTLRGARSGRPVADFLKRHAGGLTEADIGLFLLVFTAQLRSGGFFQARCATCHGRAYEFARLRLLIADSRLVGRYSGREVSTFLPGHARMTAEEARRMLEALTALRQGAR